MEFAIVGKGEDFVFVVVVVVWDATSYLYLLLHTLKR